MQHLNLINMGMGLSFVPEYLLKFLNDNVKIIATDVTLPTLTLYANYSQYNQNLALQHLQQALQQSASSL